MAKRSHALHILCIWNLLCVCGWVCSHAFASDLASSSLPSLSGIWYPTLYFVPFQVGHSLTALETFAEHCLTSTLSNLLFGADLQNAWTVLTLNDLHGFISRFLSLSGQLSFLGSISSSHLTFPHPQSSSFTVSVVTVVCSVFPSNTPPLSFLFLPSHLPWIPCSN